MTWIPNEPALIGQIRMFSLLLMCAIFLNLIPPRDTDDLDMHFSIRSSSKQYPHAMELTAEVFEVSKLMYSNLLEDDFDYLLLATGPFICASCKARYENCLRIRNELVNSGLSVKFAFVWWTPTIEYGLTFLRLLGVTEHTYLMREREIFYTVEPALGYSMTALLNKQLQILLLGSPSPETPEFWTYIGQVVQYAQEGYR